MPASSHDLETTNPVPPRAGLSSIWWVAMATAIVLAVAVILLRLRETRDKTAPEYPGKAWSTRSPAEVGMDAARLDALRDLMGGDGCVVRHGYLAYTWGDPCRRFDVLSVAKVWFTHFLLRAVEDGRLKSVEDLVSVSEPRLNDLNASLGHKDRAISWRHVACQVSCYGVEERPGEAFDYSDYNAVLFGETLFQGVYHTPWERIRKTLQPMLIRPLECQDDPAMVVMEKPRQPGRLLISPRDLARFGLLYLRQGKWRGLSLLDAKDVAMAVSSPLPPGLPETKGKPAEMIPGQCAFSNGPQISALLPHLGSYSYAWWTNGVDREGRRHWPDAPLDTYAALGGYGTRGLAVMPSLDLVVTWNRSKIDSRELENEALDLLARATREPALATAPGTQSAK